MPKTEKKPALQGAADHTVDHLELVDAGFPADTPEEEERRLASEELLYELAQLYKVFADETRIRILSALLDGEAGVGSLSSRLNMSMSAVSHSLRILKSARLVRCRREGKGAFYSLCDDHVRMILLLGLDHVSE